MRVLKKIGMSWVGTMQEREDTPYMHRYEITHAYQQRHEKHPYDLNDA